MRPLVSLPPNPQKKKNVFGLVYRGGWSGGPAVRMQETIAKPLQHRAFRRKPLPVLGRKVGK